MKTQAYSLKKRLNMLLLVCLVPLTIMVIYLVTLLVQFSNRYDGVVKNITAANAYNTGFKEELTDIELLYEKINEAKNVFEHLYQISSGECSRELIEQIAESLMLMDSHVQEVEAEAKARGYFDKNIGSLDFDIRSMAEHIQEQIQEYIYYETTNLEELREVLREDLKNTLQVVAVLFVIMLTGAVLVSKRIMKNITGPIRRLSEVAAQAGQGDFQVRVQADSDDEIAVLYTSFNQMLEKIGNLVEDIRIEQLNLRATELKLLQAQINPHFLYNTLDAIIWLAESNQKEQVVKMVSALSEFFRTTLSKGQDYISVQEEEAHIRSYLQIQRFRYRDILDYQIEIPKELYDYQVLKLTLQPLVENALYHGIKNKRGMGHIRVIAKREENEIIFKVHDDGIGMTEKRLGEVRRMIKEKAEEKGARSGFGLSNVEQRITLNYGKKYGLNVESVYKRGTTVTVKLPAIKK